MKNFIRLFTIIASLTLSLCMNVFANNAPIHAAISLNNNTFNDQSDVIVSVTLTNMSQKKVKLLRWNLPTERLDTDAFIIKRSGQSVDYQGRLIKRAKPREKDFIKLKAGDSYSAIVELSSAYDITATGNYEIRLRIDNLITDNQEDNAINSFDSKNNSSLQSNTVYFWMQGSNDQSRSKLQPDSNNVESMGNAGSAALSCSNSERSRISSASSAARSMANNAYSYLNRGTIRSRYTTWFGSYSWNRLSRVKSNFSRISNSISRATYDCSCNQNYYAYVYANQPYRIYLCNAFWRAPRTGTDSKAGTIIHELSHFNVVARTRDYAYGHSRAKSLARRSPNTAIQNADSHEYFAENSPRRP